MKLWGEMNHTFAMPVAGSLLNPLVDLRDFNKHRAIGVVGPAGLEPATKRL